MLCKKNWCSLKEMKSGNLFLDLKMSMLLAPIGFSRISQMPLEMSPETKLDWLLRATLRLKVWILKKRLPLLLGMKPFDYF